MRFLLGLAQSPGMEVTFGYKQLEWEAAEATQKSKEVEVLMRGWSMTSFS